MIFPGATADGGVRLCGCTAMRLYGYAAMRLYGCTAVRLYGYAAMRPGRVGGIRNLQSGFAFGYAVTGPQSAIKNGGGQRQLKTKN